jgi:hypothetical protein
MLGPREANLLAAKIDEIIANVRSKKLGYLHNASSKLLWRSVVPRKRDVVNNSSSHLLEDLNRASKYFANFSVDSLHYAGNIQQSFSLPKYVHAGQYLAASYLSPSCSRAYAAFCLIYTSGFKWIAMLIFSILLRRIG